MDNFISTASNIIDNTDLFNDMESEIHDIHQILLLILFTIVFYIIYTTLKSVVFRLSR